MNLFHKIISFVVILLLSENTFAQDKKVEIGFRAISLGIINKSNDSYSAFGYSLQANYFIKPRISAGVFLSRSPQYVEAASDTYLQDDLGLKYTDGSFRFNRIGLSVQATTNRRKFLRANVTARIAYIENLHEYTEISVGDKGLTFGLGLGLTLKISKSISFNLLEIGYDQILSGSDFTRKHYASGAIQAQSGITFGFLTRK